jgi:hypothetical protein
MAPIDIGLNQELRFTPEIYQFLNEVYLYHINENSGILEAVK